MDSATAAKQCTCVAATGSPAHGGDAAPLASGAPTPPAWAVSNPTVADPAVAVAALLVVKVPPSHAPKNGTPALELAPPLTCALALACVLCAAPLSGAVAGGCAPLGCVAETAWLACLCNAPRTLCMLTMEGDTRLPLPPSVRSPATPPPASPLPGPAPFERGSLLKGFRFWLLGVPVEPTAGSDPAATPAAAAPRACVPPNAVAGSALPATCG